MLEILAFLLAIAGVLVVTLRPRFRAPRATASHVAIDDVGARRTLPDGRIEAVRWDELVEVRIVTTDEGPFVDDVHWLLVGADGKGCVVPNDQVQPLFAQLEHLPNVSWEAIIRAQGSTENASFVVWKAEA